LVGYGLGQQAANSELSLHAQLRLGFKKIFQKTQLESIINPKAELNYDTRCANYSIVVKKNTEIGLLIRSLIIN